MSKVSDEKNEPKSNVQVNSNNISSIKPLQSMSERQLLNYVKKQTLTEENWDMQGEKEKIEEETLDFFTYFAKRKEQIVIYKKIYFFIEKFMEQKFTNRTR